MANRRFLRPLRWSLLLVMQAVAVLFSGAAPLHAQSESSLSLAGPTQLVPVATRRLPRGTVLRESDMTVARVALRGPASAQPAAVTAGWVTRRVVLAGEVLREPAVAPAPLVAAGQRVQFTYMQNGLQLTFDGVAMAAGSLGDAVAVRLGAKRRVTGLVSGPARVVATDSSRIS
ncbi:MAG: flagellar basal body P-ring formation chaperone FlgA [Gemmatimonadaceae bacterium]